MNRAHLSQLVVFAAVVRCGGFRGAAAELGIAPSAVSHAVSSLEEWLGVRLLARTTRNTRPTDEGTRLLARVSGPLKDIEMGFAELIDRAGAPAGPLRVTMPLLAAEELIVPRLAEFFARYPNIELDVRANDLFEDIVESGCDAGIRLGEHLERDMIAVRASGPRRGVIVGAPAYFAQHPKPGHPRDLMRHRCIRRGFPGGQVYRWELEKDGQRLVVDVAGPLVLPRQELVRQAARDGLGLAFVFARGVEDDLRSGRLVSVLDDWCQPFEGFYIYYPSRRQMRPALRAFIDFFGDPSGAEVRA